MKWTQSELNSLYLLVNYAPEMLGKGRWANIAAAITKKHGNIRTASACRKAYDREYGLPIAEEAE